jgi:di/tricarboxylate transporter
VTRGVGFWIMALMASLASWLPPTLAVLILLGATYSWVSGRLPADLTALLAMVALLVTGVLSPEETFAGFSHPATLSVSAMLVLSAGLERTGAISFVARRFLSPLGGSELVLTAALMLVVTAISAFVNNTAAVAMFIPVVREVCRRTGARPGKLMMPLAHAATFGGLCTLMGTSTNVVGHEFARAQGLSGFGMFEFGYVGLPMAFCGIVYVLLVGRRFLPAGGREGAGEEPGSGDYQAELVVLPGSPWIGRRLRQAAIQRDHEVEVLSLLRNGSERRPLGSWLRFTAGDKLRVRGPLARVLALENLPGLELHRPGSPPAAPAPKPEPEPQPAPAVQAPVAPATPVPVPVAKVEPKVEPKAEPAEERPLEIREVIVLPRSWLIGGTLAGLRFAQRFGAVVLALHRPGEPLHEPSATHSIRAGDVLVLEGEPEALDSLIRNRGLYFIGKPEVPAERPTKVWIALLVLAGVIATVAVGLAPIVVAATAGAAVLMLTGCLQPREAYRAIDLELVFLLAGSLALGRALEATGVTVAFGEALGALGGGLGLYAVLGGFLIGSVVISELMSNGGTVLLLGPVAMTTATQLGMNPMSLLAAIVFGASAAFAMPIGYQTSLMVLGPGGYRVKDFVRMGLPLDILLIVIALILIPRIWPLLPPG